MEKLELKQTDSLCPTPEQLLLDYVKQNDANSIRKLLREQPHLVSKIYGHPFDNPILYIAISKFADVVSPETVDTLIDCGANLFYSTPEDHNQEAIHFAVIGGNPLILETVIKRIPRRNVNAVTSNGSTALSLLIKNGKDESPNFEKCLRTLLSSDDVDINRADDKNRTPIVEAARMKKKRAVELLLECGKHIDIDNYKFHEKTARTLIEENNLYDGVLPQYIANNNNSTTGDQLFSYLRELNEDAFELSTISDVDQSIPEGTLLQFACKRNLKRAVQYLLHNNADVTKVAEKCLMTPIEIAGENGFWKIFELLLPRYNKMPDNLLTILLATSINDVSDEFNHKLCLKMLIESDKPFEVNTFRSGNSALHYASKYASSNVVLNLLSRGASLANKNDYNLLPIEDIPPKTLEQHFDSCIKITHVPKFDKQNTVVTFDYKTLVPSTSAPRIDQIDIESKLVTPNTGFIRETDTLMELARIKELRPLLKHPLITSLLYLKWHRIRMFFYANLAFYCIFVLSLFLHIFVPKNGDYKFVNSASFGVLVLTYVVLLIREFSQIIISPKTYLLSFENWLELGLVSITGYIISKENTEQNLFKQLSATAILLSALEMMLLIGQHPKLSTYIVIFKTVSTNFFKFLLWYAILILAFVLSFYELFNKVQETNPKNSTEEGGEKDFFDRPDLTFIKIIVMLTGEFDAGSLNFETLSNKLLFLIFVFLIPITLFNLLNGLAVSDTQIIQENAEIVSYIERINYIVYIENMMLGSIIPSTFLCLFRKCTCCCDTNQFKQRNMLKWLAQRICLFPSYYKNYKAEMYLYHHGKVKRNFHGRCNGLKEIYLDDKTVKRVKRMLRDKDDNEISTEEQNSLQAQIKNLQDTLNKFVINGCVQCKI